MTSSLAISVFISLGRRYLNGTISDSARLLLRLILIALCQRFAIRSALKLLS